MSSVSCPCPDHICHCKEVFEKTVCTAEQALCAARIVGCNLGDCCCDSDCQDLCEVLCTAHKAVHTVMAAACCLCDCCCSTDNHAVRRATSPKAALASIGVHLTSEQEVELKKKTSIDWAALIKELGPLALQAVLYLLSTFGIVVPTPTPSK